jgi:hypothetical protein
MRRLVFILMIALLPLRGWMGEAMATEMATMHLIATQATNTPAIAEFDTENGTNSISNRLEASADVTMPSAAMPADCEMHAKSKTTSVSDTPPAKQLCSHCQACHAVGLAGTVQMISSTTTHNPAPAAYVALFASAPLALSQKPPIL